MRKFTQEELTIVIEAENQLRAKGLIVDETDDKASADHNSKVLADYLEKLDANIVLTVKTILDAAEALRDHLIWKSSVQLEYESLYNQLSADQQNQFGSWWHQQSRTLVLEGDPGFENAAQILAWMRGRVFDQRNFDLALSNLAGNSRRPIHWAPARVQSPAKPSHAPSGSFMPRDEVNLTARDHARRAAEAAGAGRISSKPMPDYRELAEAVKGQTHSKTEQINRMFVMDGRSIDWEKTYISRRRAAGL